MLFKTALLGYCAALLAVTIATTSNTKDPDPATDATSPKRHHMVERLAFPSLERRQQPLSNQTSTLDIISSTSALTTISSTSIQSEELPSSTLVKTPSIIIPGESPSSSAITPASTLSTPGLTLTPFTSSSGNDDRSSSPMQSSTDSPSPSSIRSASKQQPSVTLTTILSSPSQDATSERKPSPTTIEVTSLTSSLLVEVPASSAMDISSSTFVSMSETITMSDISSSASSTPSPLPTSALVVSTTDTFTLEQKSTAASEEPLPPDNTQVFTSTSTSISTQGTSQTSSISVFSSASQSVVFTSAIEALTSIAVSPITQTFVPEISSVVTSSPMEFTSKLVPASATSVEQQSSASSVTSLDPTNSQAPSSAAPASVTSSSLDSFSDLPQQTFTTSSSGQAAASTSLSAMLSSTGKMSSSSAQGVFPSAPLQPTTMAMSSSETISFVSQTVVTSGAFASSTVTTDITPSSSSVVDATTSVISAPGPSSVASSLGTAASASSAMQTLTSSGTEQSLSSGSPKSTVVISETSSTIGPSVVHTSQSPVMAPTSQTPIQLSSDSLSSSLVHEPSSAVSEVASSVNPPTLTTIASQTMSSISDSLTSLDAVPFTQTESSSSDTAAIPSSIPTLASMSSTNPQVTGSSLGISPLPISINSAITTNLTASEPQSIPTELPVVSTGTATVLSMVLESSVFSSFLPSETPFTSANTITATSSEVSFGLSRTSISTVTFLSTRTSITDFPPSATSSLQQSASSFLSASESQATFSLASSSAEPPNTAESPVPTSIRSHSVSGSSMSESGVHMSTSVATPSVSARTSGSIPTSELLRSTDSARAYESGLLTTSMPSLISSLLSSGSSGTSSNEAPLASSIVSNSTQTGTLPPINTGTVTATFSTVYVSNLRPSVLDPSTVAFSLFSSVAGAAVSQTAVRTSIAQSTTLETQVPASESLRSSSGPGLVANSTWTSTLKPSTGSTELANYINSTTSSTVQLGITFSQSALPTGASTSTSSGFNATHAETLQTSSAPDAANSTTAGFAASTTAGSVSGTRTDTSSSATASGSDPKSTTDGVGSDHTETVAPHVPTSTPSQTAAAGSPPPLTTSQTAGVAVGATTGLLIAVVAAIFIARRYHAAKGKRMSTGSVYPKVAYLYDPKTGGDGGDAEAFMSGGIPGLPPAGPPAGAAQGSPRYMQRHSTGTMPANRFTNLGNPFAEPVRDPAVHRYSEYARIDTTRALSAAVAGYSAAPRHSSSYTKYPSDVTNPFSDHVIPSPTFAPFSPDNIKRPEPPTPQSVHDGTGDYSQMPVNTYACLNTPASMYPPVSPYGRPVTMGSSPTYDMRRHTIDSDPFADPFEHDLLLQVDERDRTSDSVTIFAPSPNLKTPRTPRTPVGPKLPVRHPDGMTSARSLLSPVAAKYMQKAQEVKIPRKSVASPILVQVGRSPVIKPFSPPPAAPEPVGWDEIKRHSEKRYSDEQSVPAPLKFASPVITRKPVPTSHTRTKPSLTGAGHALLAGNGLPLTVNIPHMHKKSVGLDVPRVHGRPNPAHEDVSSDPVVREKRSRELRFADPALIGKDF